MEHKHSVIGSESYLGRRYVLCSCSCGNRFKIRADNMKSFNKRSCSARQRERHGMSNSITYKSWASMLNRCLNQKGPHFKNYGGRGVRVCERWANSFLAFRLDMGDRPSLKHSIDRKDVNGDYTPENCRWALWVDQCNNKRNNVFLVVAGETLTVAQASRKFEVNVATIRARLGKGLSPRLAVRRVM